MKARTPYMRGERTRAARSPPSFKPLAGPKSVGGKEAPLVTYPFGRIAALACSVLLAATPSSGQFPQSVICEFERIATAELDATGKIVTGGDSSKGELVISNLNSATPASSGNVGSIKLRILAKSQDTIWLGEVTGGELTGVITLFSKTGIVMYTKYETLRTGNGEKPFGFVEIGRFRPLK